MWKSLGKISSGVILAASIGAGVISVNTFSLAASYDNVATAGIIGASQEIDEWAQSGNPSSILAAADRLKTANYNAHNAGLKIGGTPSQLEKAVGDVKLIAAVAKEGDPASKELARRYAQELHPYLRIKLSGARDAANFKFIGYTAIVVTTIGLSAGFYALRLVLSEK